MGSRRGFICRMKIGNMNPETMPAGHLNRLKQRNSLGPSRDGQNFAVIHCTGYIKNWPPTGQFDNPLTGLYLTYLTRTYFIFVFVALDIELLSLTFLQ